MIAPLEMAQLWDRTRAFVRARRGVLAILAGAAIVVPDVIEGLAAAAAQRPGSGGPWMLVRLPAALLMLWAQLAIAALAVAPEDRSAALRLAARRLPVVIGFVLLLSVAMTLLSLPAAVILGSHGYDFAAAATGARVQPSAVAAAWVGLYLLLLLPLLMWLAARLILVIPVVLEERQGLRAISRAFALTRGLAAGILGMLLLYGVVSLVLGAAVRFAGGSVLVLLFGSDDGLGAASVLILLLTAVVEAGLAVLFWAFLGKLYLAAREQRNGTAAHS